MGQVRAMEATLAAAGVRVKVDTSEGRSAGWKFNFWEMKGPLLPALVSPSVGQCFRTGHLTRP